MQIWKLFDSALYLLMKTDIPFHATSDIDECADNENNCPFDCTNTAGSYLCSCPVGFFFDEDTRNCTGRSVKFINQHCIAWWLLNYNILLSILKEYALHRTPSVITAVITVPCTFKFGFVRRRALKQHWFKFKRHEPCLPPYKLQSAPAESLDQVVHNAVTVWLKQRVTSPPEAAPWDNAQKAGREIRALKVSVNICWSFFYTQAGNDNRYFKIFKNLANISTDCILSLLGEETDTMYTVLKLNYSL